MQKKHNSNSIKQLKLSNPVYFLALGFGAGLISKAPGTWGSLVGLLLGWVILQFISLSFFIILTIICFVLGCLICEKTSIALGVHDHGSIVWDEIVGIFIVLLAIPALTWQWCLIAFVIFRFFDITKFFPIRYFDNKLKSGFGIMIDDVLAAIYSVIVIKIISFYFFL